MSLEGGREGGREGERREGGREGRGGREGYWERREGGWVREGGMGGRLGREGREGREGGGGREGGEVEKVGGREGGREGREGGREGGREAGREGGREGGREDCYTYYNRYVQFFLYRNVLFNNHIITSDVTWTKVPTSCPFQYKLRMISKRRDFRLMNCRPTTVLHGGVDIDPT